MPDCLRAFEAGEPVRLRYPDAVRPWQHVLEPLSGYLLLAGALLGDAGADHAKAWNFGPNALDEWPVGEVARAVARHWGDGAVVEVDTSARHPHEAGLLRLDSTLARAELGWRPRWDLETAIGLAVAWHREWEAGHDMQALTRAHIERYMTEPVT